MVEECLEVAVHAPTPSNSQYWDFVVVEDPEKKRVIGDHYRQAWEVYLTLPIAASNLPVEGDQRRMEQLRATASAQYLADHYHEVPIMMIPCIHPRADKEEALLQCSFYGGVIQAAWSFQLAARARGLASCWTSLHLMFEREIAGLLGIDYDETQQVAAICLGWSKGTDFKPSPREPLADKLHWDSW